MNRRLTVLVLCALLLSFFIVSCVTEGDTSVPAWISRPPSDTDEAVFFVGFGRGDTIRSAEASAREDLVVQIVARYTDELAGSSVSIAEDRARDRAEQRVDSIPDDRYVRSIDTEKNVYLLLRYDRAVFRADVRDIGPTETDAPGGRDPDAGTNADLPPLDLARFAFDRAAGPSGGLSDLQEALNAARRARIEVTPTVVEYQLGSLAELFVALSADVVSPTRFVVTYPKGYTRSGSVPDRTRAVVGTGAQTILLASPERVGDHRVTIAPEFSREAFGELVSGGGGDKESFAVAEEVRAALQREVIVRAFSDAPEIPTAVVIVDADIVQNPISTNQTSAAVTRHLSDADFAVRQADVGLEEQEWILRADALLPKDVYEMLPFELLAAVDRVIIGKAWIVDFQEDNGYIVRVTLTADVMDLRRDKNLLSLSVNGMARGNDSRTSIRAAFQAAGSKLAAEVASLLP